MNNPVSAISYLARAKQLRRSGEKAELIYAALELRCGVEARLKEHISVAAGVSKTQLAHYEIRKLSKTVNEAFGLGDTFLLIFLQLDDGRTGQFTYAPVTSRLQEIASRLGDYLHAVPHERATGKPFWAELRSLLSEGCTLLELACASEVIRPTFEQGIHLCLSLEDPRNQIVEDYMRGTAGTFRTVTLSPAGPMTCYQDDEQ